MSTVDGETPTATAAGRGDQRRLGAGLRRSGALQQLGLALILLAIVLLSIMFVPNFASVRNATNIVRNVSIVVIISSGFTLLLISKGLDLAVGSTMALASVVVALCFTKLGLPIFVCILAGLVVGALVGLLNALIINRFGVLPILTTLATQTAVRGLAYQIAGGLPIPLKEPHLQWLGEAMIGPVPVPVIIAVLVVLFFYFVQTRTVVGIHLYSVGGNEEAASLSGIPVVRIKYLLYTLTGLCAAISGLIVTGRLVSGQPSAGAGMEFDCITAIIVGGTSLDGGVGSVLGTVVGALFIAVINNIMVLEGLGYYGQLIAKGVIIVVAIVLDQRIRRMR